MISILGALLPVFALIALGYGFRRAGFPGDNLWPPLERLIYYVLFPALLINRLANAELGGFAFSPFLAALFGAVLFVGALSFLAKRTSGMTDAAFGAVFMGAVRFNTYVGIGAAGAVWGEAGLTIAAVVLAIWIPLVNFLSVWVLLRTGGAGATTPMPWARLALGTITNPLIVACGFGAALNLTGLGLPFAIDRLVAVLGAAALPLGLLSVGAGLELGRLRLSLGPLAMATALKLAVMPLTMLGATKLFGVTGLSATVLILFAALPGSPAAFILARQMGGDGPLMAGIITVTTLISVITLPTWIAVVQ